MTEYDLWTEASYDAEAETQALHLEMAKHASSGLWSFLALASSPEEYADRVALAADGITATATAQNVPVETLLEIFDQRFALLMEAGDNPFAKDSQDSDGDDTSESKDDNGDGHDDDSDEDEDSDDTGDGDDEDDSDDDKGDGADDTGDQTDKDDDGDTDNADNDSKGQSQDPDQDSDEDQGRATGISPWGSRYAHLATAIQQGSNPLEWGGAAPFARSSARKHADGAAPVTDTNVPQDPAAAGAGAPSVPGMDGGIAETTKPRQLPEGDGGMGSPGMGMDGITDQFDPAMNGGDIQQGADSVPAGAPEPDTGGSDKIAAITAEVRRYNPTLSPVQCRKVAQQVYDRYLTKHADDVNPLLYGDRGPVADGPITNTVKNWSPTDMKAPKLPGAPGGSGAGPSGGTPGAGAPKTPGMPELPAAGAGELAAGAGEAAELLPLLAL